MRVAHTSEVTLFRDGALCTVHVRLSLADAADADPVGYARQEDAMRRNLRAGWEPQPGEDSLLSQHHLGARGEKAGSIAFDCPWSRGVGTFHSGVADVPPYEIRTRRWRESPLTVYPSDKQDAPAVLVIGDGLDYTLVGWAWVWEAREGGTWADPKERGKPGWHFPRARLRSMDSAPTVVQANGFSSVLSTRIITQRQLFLPRQGPGGVLVSSGG